MKSSIFGLNKLVEKCVEKPARLPSAPSLLVPAKNAVAVNSPQISIVFAMTYGHLSHAAWIRKRLILQAPKAS